MPRRDDYLLIADIVQSCQKIMDYTAGMGYDDFIADSKTMDAVVRNFEIIGEATKLVSDSLKAQHALIEWRLLTDFRNILIHQYFGVDYEKVWGVIGDELRYNFQLLKAING